MQQVLCEKKFSRKKKKVIPLCSCTDNFSPLSFLSLIYTLKTPVTPIVCFKGAARAPGLYRRRAVLWHTGSEALALCSALGVEWEEMSCALGEPWGTSAERMKFPLWKPLCAPALVKSAIKSSVLNTFFNDVLNSEVSKCRSWAFDIKLIRTTGFFSPTL